PGPFFGGLSSSTAGSSRGLTAGGGERIPVACRPARYRPLLPSTLGEASPSKNRSCRPASAKHRLRRILVWIHGLFRPESRIEKGRSGPLERKARRLRAL